MLLKINALKNKLKNKLIYFVNIENSYIFALSNNKQKFKIMAKLRTVKQAMNSESVKLVKIYAKYNKEIRLDFAPRYGNNGAQFQSFWINRDYFQRNYPNTYDRF